MMKHCAQCNRTYADESLAFCLADGALLSAPYDSEATQRIPLERSTNLPPTEVLQHRQPRPIPQKGTSKFIYAVVGVMVGLVITLTAIILIPRMSRDRKENGVINQQATISDKSLNNTSNMEARPTHATKTEQPPGPASRASDPNNPNLPLVPPDLTGRWQGQWSSPFGTLFSADVYLEETGTGNGVQGSINWTMKSTPQVSKQSKIGHKAVENVRGSYDLETRMLTMEGYREDDPNNIITPDKYRLVLAPDNRTLGGATWNHGGWRGRLSLTR